MALEILRELLIYHDQSLSYAFFEELLDVSRTTIFRYTKQEILPKEEIADKIIVYALENHIIEQLIHSSIRSQFNPATDTHLVDTSHLLSNTRRLQLIAYLIKKQYLDQVHVDKIVTSEVDGIPFAYALAYVLNVPCVYARKRQPVAVAEYYESPIETTSSRQVMLYIPKESLSPDEKVIVCDDVIRSGKTQCALLELIRKANAIPIAAIILIKIGNAINSGIFGENQIKSHIIYSIGDENGN